MKIRTNNLKDKALDWVVAQAEGREPFINTPYDGCSYTDGGRSFVKRYSTDWAQGGPIIDHMVREGLRLTGYKSLPTDPTSCQAQIGNIVTGGPTPLIAAMRCFCCSKLGDVVDIPEELCQQQNS